MSAVTQLSLVLLVALAVAAILLLRRLARLAARTRDLERFQRITADLDARFGASADPLVAHLDEIRRRAGDPAQVTALLPGVSDGLRRAASEARSLRPPRALADHAAGLVRELDRGVRATEMVEHGLDALLLVRGSRELEAQTSLKRGALNLRHARGAFHQLAVEILRVRPADIAERPGSRSTGATRGVHTYRVEGIEGEIEGPFEPRI